MEPTPAAPPAGPSITQVVAANVRGEVARLSVQRPEISEVLGLSQATLSKRMTGHVPFTLRELVLLARHLRLPLYRLLAGVMEARP